MNEEYLRQTGKIWTTADMPNNLVETEVVAGYVQTVQSLISSTHPKSVLITGDRGVGKTTLIQLASKYLKKRGWFIFEATSGNLMAGQRYIGDLEKNVQTVLRNMISRRKNLWVVPRFHELYYGGRHEFSPVSILDQVLPFVETGELKLLGEIDNNSLEKVALARPQILSTFKIFRVEELDKRHTMELAKKWMQADQDIEVWKKFTLKDLDEVQQLASQYLSYKQNPGCMMDLMQQTRKLHEAKEKKSKYIQLPDFIDTLSDITGMPKAMLDDGEQLDLEKLKTHFSNKVLGQDDAVRKVIERIAMMKAGLTDPTKPTGVFLFVGPTGTGKTEIAKAIADYLFGSEDKLIRLDMSEYKSMDSTYKIIGDASDHSESTALVNTIRKKPFSIVLLDEFEKAHPNIWDMFLQVFDDGRLTDQRGAVADFRHCIIILTSNLGASIPPSTGRIGYTNTENDPKPDVSTNVMNSINQTFRPEFINRIDHIVVFNPLTKSIAKSILRNELKKVLQRRGIRKRTWDVDFEDSALEFLLEKGFSSSLGARPLKRAIEQYLLAPLAMTIVNHDFPKGDQFLLVSTGKDKLKVTFIDPDEPEYSWEQKKQILESQKVKAAELDLKTIILHANGVLSEFDVIHSSLQALEDGIESNRLMEEKEDLMNEMAAPEFWSSLFRHETLSKIEFLDRFQSSFDSARKLFDRLYHPEQERLVYNSNLLSNLAQKIFLLELALDSYLNGKPQDSLLKISYALSDQEQADKVERMYKAWARNRGMQLKEVHDAWNGDEHSKLFVVYGFGAFTLLEKESGYHVFESREPGAAKVTRSKVRVSILPMEQADYREFEIASVEKRFAQMPAAKPVRKYKAGKSPLIKDLKKNWQTGKVNSVMEGNFDVMS